MLHGNKSIIKHKIGLLNLADELGNVSQACRIMGLSRDRCIAITSRKKHWHKTFKSLLSRSGCMFITGILRDRYRQKCAILWTVRI